MIRKVKLKDFESHEDSEIEFDDGFNLIVGQSNQGKSSIVRALALVAANRFDKDSVRSGARSCMVRVETDRGWVQAERGEGVNNWTVCIDGTAREYRNVGTGVPPGVLEAIGIGERVHGGVVDMPNVMFQLDGHYMLSEVDGKKATGSMVARMMDDAIGLGGLEGLITAIAQDTSLKRKELSDVGCQISDLKSRAGDEDEFKDMEGLFGKCESIVERIGNDERTLDKFGSLCDRMSAIDGMIASLDGRLGVFSRLMSCADRCSRLSVRLKALCEAEDARRRLSALDETLALLGKALSAGDDARRLSGRLQAVARAEELSSALRRTERISAKVLEDAEGGISNGIALAAKIGRAEKSLSDARLAWCRMSRKERELSDVESRLDAASERMSVLRRRLGRCPLCGADLVEGEAADNAFLVIDVGLQEQQ